MVQQFNGFAAEMFEYRAFRFLELPGSDISIDETGFDLIFVNFLLHGQSAQFF